MKNIVMGILAHVDAGKQPYQKHCSTVVALTANWAALMMAPPF